MTRWTMMFVLLGSGCMATGGVGSDPDSKDDPFATPGGDPGEVPREEPPAEDPGPDRMPDPGEDPAPDPIDAECVITPDAGTCAAPFLVENCSTATVTVDTAAGSSLADPATCAAGATGQKDVVIEIVPSKSGHLTASIAGVAGEWRDTVMFARSTCPGTDADEVACNDDAAGDGRSRVELDGVEVGVPVYLFVQAYREMYEGEMDVEISITDHSPADVGSCDPTGATDVSGASATVSLVGSGTEHVRVPTSCSSSCSLNAAGDAVLRYTPDRDGTLTISTDNPGTTAGTDTLLAVFDACDGPASVPMACDDDAGTTIALSSVVTLPVVARTPVFVGVDLCRSTATADVEVTFRLE